LRIHPERQFVVLLGLGRVARLEFRFRQIIPRPEFRRLLARSVFEKRQGIARVLLTKQEDAAVQFRFKKPGLEFEGLAILRDAIGVALQEAIGQGQIEVEEIIL
jgi:regulator of protease activity HflC (stomatin/prohibitin superfamily)